MSTLSLPSGSYRSSSNAALTHRLQRFAFRFLHRVGSAGVAAWEALMQGPAPFGREPGNAAELRAYADLFESSQPGFAADLRAVAMRDRA